MKKLFLMMMIALVAMGVSVGVIFAQETETDEAEGWLGIRVRDEDDQVVIARVMTGSPANAADLLIGDVIVSFNGEAVDSAENLVELVKAGTPGDTVTVEVLRNGAAQSIEVTLGSKPNNRRGHRLENLPEDALSAVEILLHADLQATANGFEVTNVFAGRNPFDLQEGDVINSVNGQPVAEFDVAALVTALADAENPELTVVITRDGEEVTITEELHRGRGGRHGGRGGRDGRGGFGPDDERPAPTEEPTQEPAG